MKYEPKKNNIKRLSESFFVIKTISSFDFLTMVNLIHAGKIDIEKLQNCVLNLKTMEPAEEFESVQEFFQKYDCECLHNLYNFEDIKFHIINPIKCMEEIYENVESAKSDAKKWSIADDQYNLEKGN